MEHQTHEATHESREVMKSKIQIYDMDAHVKKRHQTAQAGFDERSVQEKT